MKTQSISLVKQLKPVIVFCAVILSLAGLSAYVSAADKVPSVQAEQLQEVVNINTADVAQLTDGLKGIGAKKAQAIIDYREQLGKFTSLEQLLEVKGIGEKTLELNRDRIRL